MKAKLFSTDDAARGRWTVVLAYVARSARSKWTRAFLLAVAVGFLGTGCAVYPAGYSTGYYEPDYSPYYGSYGYGGAPWDVGFGDILVGGYHHHGFYGGHHIGHDFGGFHGGGHAGGGRR